MKDCERFEKAVQAYIAGEPPGVDIEQLLEHTRICDDCRRLLALHRELAELGQRFEQLRGGGFAPAERPAGGLERVGRLSLPANEASFIEAVVDYVQDQTEPGEPVFDFSSSAALLA